ncbi:hypothetical protein PanWU01x14_243190, partial [Parasponia andersonii]
DLHGFIDGTQPSPNPTITTNGTRSTNLAYLTWKRQDRLIFSALLSAVSSPLQPLLTQTTSSHAAWDLLANTYAKPSRGHIKHIKDQIKNYIKGTKTIFKYMQFIRTCVDELALLSKPIDEEDLTDRILEGLGDEYKSIADAVNARETPLTFDELHEKLINKEASLKHQSSSPFPITANLSTQRTEKLW